MMKKLFEDSQIMNEGRLPDINSIAELIDAMEFEDKYATYYNNVEPSDPTFDLVFKDIPIDLIDRTLGIGGGFMRTLNTRSRSGFRDGEIVFKAGDKVDIYQG